MRQIWLVARRDYLEHVKSIGFLIAILIVPIMLVASIGVPMLLERSSGPTAFAMLDVQADWVKRIEAQMAIDEETKKDLKFEVLASTSEAQRATMLEDLKARVKSEKLYGYITPATEQNGEQTLAITTRTDSANDGLRWLRRNLPNVVRMARAEKLGLTPQQTAQLYSPVDIKSLLLSLEGDKIKESSATDKLAAFAPMIFTYLLWLTVFTLVQQLLMSTLEEKTNRTIEVILSSVSPFEFMAGKVLAGVLQGLTVLTAWLGTLAIFAGYLSQHYLKGIDLTILFANKAHLAFFAIYFALGFIMFAAITVGLGSLCSTARETQGLMTPVMLAMMMPLLAMQFVGDNPNSTIAVVMSYIPIFTPFLMMNRIAATPPPSTLDITAASAVLIFGIVAAVWAGAKLFRIGILMYGKPPRLGEVFRLLISPASRTMP